LVLLTFVLPLFLSFSVTGLIVHYSGLHVGTMNDKTIINQCQYQYPPALLPWEWSMGDGAFEAAWHILVEMPEAGAGRSDEGAGQVQCKV
jgi:hypothetical protein